jgi:DNA-directed RNA polymerase subunit RPC12/RpoP
MLQNESVMASILITCPDCKKQLNGPAELVGKKVRCKSCGHAFAVKATRTGPSAAPVQKAGARKGPQQDLDGKNPYRLSDILPTHRCPQCAADMEEDDIICVRCGYNTQTRLRHTTLRTYETTATDRMLWLTPGVLSAIGMLVLIGIIGFLWLPFGLPKLSGEGENKAWWGHFSIQVYGSVLCGFLGWVAGKFAFGRLIAHPNPPEKLRYR